MRHRISRFGGSYQTIGTDVVLRPATRTVSGKRRRGRPRGQRAPLGFGDELADDDRMVESIADRETGIGCCGFAGNRLKCQPYRRVGSP